jgi:hypothetical protein
MAQEGLSGGRSEDISFGNFRKDPNEGIGVRTIYTFAIGMGEGR